MNIKKFAGRVLLMLAVLILASCERGERVSVLTFVATFTPTPTVTATPLPTATPTLIPIANATEESEAVAIATTPTAGEQAFIDAVNGFANSEVGEWVLSDVENPQEVTGDAIIGIARNILAAVYAQLQEQGALPEDMPTLEDALEVLSTPEKALAFGSCFNPAIETYEENQDATALAEQLANCIENVDGYEGNLDLRRAVTDFIINQITTEE